MDIWKWVMDTEHDLREAGNDRLADLIESIPDDTNQNRPELVEAAMPEALAGARAIKNPWLEVFFRHWGINNRMSDMIEGEKALPEVVSLLEFTHRDETINCPQTICATQDIAMCYGNIDGPGWVAERLAVCEEALSKINPEWPCFGCISEEYALALLDAKRNDEALQFLAQQTQARLEAGEEVDVRFIKINVRAQLQEGKYAEALALIDNYDADDDTELAESDEIIMQILRAIILAHTGQYAAAWQAVPSWDNIKPVAYPQWAQAVLVIAKADTQYNSWQIGRLLQRSVDYLASVGAHRHTVDTAIAHIELALDRKAHWSALRALKVAQTHAAKLRKPAEVTPALADLEKRINAITPASDSLPVPAAELAAYLNAQEDGSPENDVQHLLQACKQLPHDAELASFAANALAACGALEECKNHLWQFVRANPTVDGPNYSLANRILDTQDHAAIAQLVSEIEAVNPSAALWFNAQSSYQQKRYDEACTHLSAYADKHPESIGALDFWAQAALANQDIATALRIRKQLVESSQPETDELIDNLWGLVIMASAAEDWPTVRKTALQLGMELEDATDETGVIEENWGLVFMQIAQNNDTKNHLAYRTGPATARILAHSNAPDDQHLSDWVAFDVRPLEPMPESEEERENFITTFKAIHVIKAGGYGHSCFCDGAHPGKKAFAKFEEALQIKGWALNIASEDDYSVTDPDKEDATLPGCYFQIAAPLNVTPKEIDAALLTLSASWKHPICWPRFADRAGIDTARHMEIVERYDL
jgi:hypothetical protein